MKPVILAISGAKNVGKTTLITNLIPLLKKNNLSVAVIKHDGHHFVPDIPNTDTFLIQQAGADGTAIFSDTDFMIVRKRRNKIKHFEEELLKAFPDVSLTLLEGFKNTNYPKIELLREGINTVPFSPMSSLLALVSNTNNLSEAYPDIPFFLFEDMDKICGFILSYYHMAAKPTT